MVDLEFAGVFMPSTSKSPVERTQRRTKTSNARWLTSETEVERARSVAKEKEEKNAAIAKKKQEKEQKQKEKEEEIQRKKDAKKKAELRNLALNDAEEAAMMGKLKRRVCNTCASKVKADEIAMCVLCPAKYHKNCIKENSFTTICKVCICRGQF